MIRNWSGVESRNPVKVIAPTTADEVAAVVRSARERGQQVKAIGSGHSFTSIALTDGVQVRLEALAGVRSVDGTRVTLGAGTRLHELPALLGPLGLALQNMGDIDRQTLAGATSTGTHGTGLAYGGLATRITGATLVDGRGEIVQVPAAHLDGVRVGLGALGILTELEIDCVPSFVLEAVEEPGHFDDILETFGERARTHDHFEAYWWPHTDWMSVKTNTRRPSGTPTSPKSRLQRWSDDELLGHYAAEGLFRIGRRFPSTTPRVNEFVGRIFANSTYSDASHAVFASPRKVRFNEMEYAVPLAALPSAVRELRALVERKGWRVSFPVELRAAAADEMWLSTAHGRETGYIAVHRYHREDHRPYFAAAEEIFQAHDGRPHWGKIHTRTAADLAPAYPHFADFLALRDHYDPDRTFANDYTRRVLGD